MRIRPTKQQFEKQLKAVASVLRQEIMEGKHEAGSFLPSEKQLAQRFDMSNNSVRKALQMLAEEGWIIKVPRVGNRVAEGRSPVHLTIASNKMAVRNIALEKLLQIFNERYPWIHVHINSNDGGLPGFGAGESLVDVDLVLMDDYQFQRLVELQLFNQLEALSSMKDYYPFLHDLFTVDGQMYMHPLIFSPVVLCYNRAHFREAGLLEPDGSWTWDYLMQCAERLSDSSKGRYGFCFHVQTANRWPIFLLQSGERFQWSDGMLNDIRGTKLMEAMKLCKRIIHNRKAFPLYLSENQGDIDRMFLAGKISMTLNSYMGLNAYSDSDLDYDISPIPSNCERKTLMISLGLGINKNSSHKHEVKLLAQFLTSEWTQQFISDHTLSIPALGTIAPQSYSSRVNKPKRFPLYREIMFTYETTRALNLTTASTHKLTNEMKAYWADMLDEEELGQRVVQILSYEGEALQKI